MTDESIQEIGVRSFVGDMELVSPRHRLDAGRVAEFARLYTEGCGRGKWNPAALPPLDVVLSPEGPVIADGWHRITALGKLAATTVPCITVATSETVEGALDLAYRHAIETAATLSLPLTEAERRDACRVLHRQGLPVEEIAQRVGVSRWTVSRATRKVEGANAHLPGSSSPDTDALMRRMVNGVTAVWEARSMSDRLHGDRLGAALASVLATRHRDDALRWAQRIRQWAEDAERRLSEERKIG